MPRSFLSCFMVLACMAMITPALAQNKSLEYQDGKRGTVVLPQGDKSFTDAVVDHSSGTGTVKDSASDPQAILGPPNFSGDVDDGSFLSLGCDGKVTLQFTDNALVDVEGPDLYVFEVGPKVEGMRLSISDDGEIWVDLGNISGGRSEIDLAGLVPTNASYRFVRLTDDGIDCGTQFAGADVDAVAAIGSTLRFVLDGAVLFAVDSTELRPEAQGALDALAQDIADAGLNEFRVVGHTDSTGDDAYNLALSQDRALAVQDYLSSQAILDAVTVTAEGRGEAEPIADNTTDNGRAENRRVEIIGK